MIRRIDPELVADLGAEFELRGDVMEAELEAAAPRQPSSATACCGRQAEFDNFRKRIAREREEERRRASERLVTELLPAIDNLERAIDARVDAALSGPDLDVERRARLLSGVEAVHAQILAVLGQGRGRGDRSRSVSRSIR